MVYVELIRRKNDVSCFRTRKGLEVDFVAVSKETRQTDLIEVYYTITPEARQRELRPLAESARGFGLTSANTVIALEEESLDVDGAAVRAVPAWRWLLEA